MIWITLRRAQAQRLLEGEAYLGAPFFHLLSLHFSFDKRGGGPREGNVLRAGGSRAGAGGAARLLAVVIAIGPAGRPPQLHSGLLSLHQGQREGTGRHFSQKCTALSVL